jgi:hypothetical protein
VKPFGNAHAKPIGVMPLYMNSTGQQAVGDDITGTSDAIVMASGPDVALPKETEPAGDGGIEPDRRDVSGWMAQSNLPAIVAAGAAGLLLGIVLKRSLPSVKGRC